MNNRFLLLSIVALALNVTALAQHTDAVVVDNSYANDAERQATEVPQQKQTRAILPNKALQKQLGTINRTATTLGYSQTGSKQATLTGFGPQGKAVFRLAVKNNELHGSFTSYYPNGNRMDSGRFEHGKPDGLWKSWYPNGALRSTMVYDAQKWQAVYNELRRANPKTGFHSNALPAASASVDGFSKLTRTIPAADGYLPPFKSGLVHGDAVIYHPNGQISDSAAYHYGLPDGLWTSWYANGQKKCQGTYLRGQKWGGWSSFSPAGNLTRLEEFKQDELLYQKVYGLKK